MKISEHIRHLQALLEKEGDIEVYRPDFRTTAVGAVCEAPLPCVKFLKAKKPREQYEKVYTPNGWDSTAMPSGTRVVVL